MSDCHLWLCSPWSYKPQIFPSTDIKYILEQKKFRITKQTLATLKLCNNTETAESRQTHWDLILLQVDINLFSVCFRSHCFQISFFLTCREIWKKSNWNANRSNLLLSFGVGVKFLLFLNLMNLLRPSCGSDTPVYLFKYSLFVKQRLNTSVMFNNEVSYLKLHWNDLCIQMCGICLRQKPVRKKSFGF